MQKNINENINLGKLLSDITKRHYQIQLTTGYADVVNGYGWHVKYYVQVHKTIEYCPKCRKKEGLNYSDTSHPFSNHKHENELKLIFSGSYMSEEDLCKSIITNCI
jgi:hypothetical protein